MICVILSFQIGCTLVGVSICKSLTFQAAFEMGIIYMKKSAFYNLSSCFIFSVTIRVVSIRIPCASGCAYIAGVSSIQSTFSLKSVLVNRHKGWYSFNISNTSFYPFKWDAGNIFNIAICEKNKPKCSYVAICNRTFSSIRTLYCTLQEHYKTRYSSELF